MMFKTFAAAALAVCATANASTISVVEIGKGGVARRTTSRDISTSFSGVMSFWRSMHEVGNNGKKSHRRASGTQYPGMTVVPDMFNNAHGGIVVGITGDYIDLASMPTVSSIVTQQGKAVGHFHVSGQNSEAFTKNINGKIVDSAASFDVESKSVMKYAVSEPNNKLESLTVRIENGESAAKVDGAVSRMLKELEKEALKTDKTFVLHLVLDHDDDNSSQRHLQSRNLSEDEGEGEEGGEGEENNSNDKDEEENKNEENRNEGGGTTVYGYYDSNGDFVTTYRTMFQIQYYNVVLWSSIGLVALLVVSTNLMIGMPLLPDTLLFGESAKMVAAD